MSPRYLDCNATQIEAWPEICNIDGFLTIELMISGIFEYTSSTKYKAYPSKSTSGCLIDVYSEIACLVKALVAGYSFDAHGWRWICWKKLGWMFHRRTIWCAHLTIYSDASHLIWGKSKRPTMHGPSTRKADFLKNACIYSCAELRLGVQLRVHWAYFGSALGFFMHERLNYSR